MGRNVGLVGAHRVGKTLLRDTLASGTGSKTFNFSISREQQVIGYDSGNQGYKAHLRMHIQERLLKTMEYALHNQFTTVAPAAMGYTSPSIIADRTPIDLIGYAIINLEREPPHQINGDWLKWYIAECIKLTNRFFHKLVLVQPGIKFEADTKSGPIEDVEPLNGAYQAMFLNPSLAVERIIMPSEMTSLQERCLFVKEFMYA